jgi:hypothetical protein
MTCPQGVKHACDGGLKQIGHWYSEIRGLVDAAFGESIDGPLRSSVPPMRIFSSNISAFDGPEESNEGNPSNERILSSSDVLGSDPRGFDGGEGVIWLRRDVDGPGTVWFKRSIKRGRGGRLLLELNRLVEGC